VKAQAAWQKANADGKIDAAEMVLIDLLMKGHKLVPIASDQIAGLSSEDKAKALSLTDDYKPYVDGMIGLAGANFEGATKARAALIKTAQNVPYTTAKGTAKRAVKAAAQANPKQFQLLNNSSYARKLVYWGTGIKAGRARDYIHASVQLRSATANGGIENLTRNLDDVGKYSKFLKGAGYVCIAVDATTSGVKAYDAYDKGDVKGGNVEVGKGLGSIAGGVAGGAAVGAFVGYLVLGVVTGGVGLVVVGVAAAAAAYGAGRAGEWGGEKVANQVNRLVLP
jgi:hypothetical protein